MAKSKRLQKKQQTQRKKQLLSTKFTAKEQRQMPKAEQEKQYKRLAANEKKKKTRAETKAFLEKQGFDSVFINKHRLNDKKASSYTSADLLKLKKAAALEAAGIKNYKKSDLKLGWEKLQDKYTTISIPEKTWQRNKTASASRKGRTYTGNYLYVGAAEVRGSFIPEDYSGFSVSELEYHINERIEEALSDIGSSDYRFCAFKIYNGDQAEVKRIANTFYNRGYDLHPEFLKMDNERYGCLVIENTWTKHRFLSMVYNCINQMKNEDVTGFIGSCRSYCWGNNFPFMNNIIVKK